MFQIRTIIAAIFAAILILTIGCGDKDPTGAHDDAFDITYTTTPATVTAGTEFTIEFLVEDEHGEHVDGLTGTECEFEMEGMAGIDAVLTAGEHGHYSGTATLTMAGDYEVHFHYMHDGEENHAAMATGITCN
jgi:hypothetical protein